MASLRRWYRAFAVIGAVALLFALVSMWTDYSRGWRRYQNAYATELRSILSGQGVRDLPNPGHVYLQTVVTPTRVDRCQMCHRAVDDPRFAQAPQPIKSHPKIPPHPFEKFGCTSCHMGQGRATEVADAHGRVPFWEEPLLGKPYVQSSCGTCHRGVALKEAPLVEKGRKLYLSLGCIACHKIHGVRGIVGPELTWVGERRKDPKWHLAHFRNPRAISAGSTMPPYAHVPEKDLVALTVYILTLREAPSGLIAAPGGAASAPPPAEKK